MPNMPRIQEIFSNKALDQAADFLYEKKEVKEQLNLSSKAGDGHKSKKGQAPPPPPATGMKKFGGYKPKILSGQDDLIEVETRTAGLDVSDSRAGKSRPAPNPPGPRSPPPQLTKPKPWVVGDKNVPMVLGGRVRDEDPARQGERGAGVHGTNSDAAGRILSSEDLTNGHTDDLDAHVYKNSTANKDVAPDDVRASALGDGVYTEKLSETSALVSSRDSYVSQGLDNPALGSLDSLAFINTNIGDANNNTNNRDDVFGGVSIPSPTPEQGFINGSYTHPAGDANTPANNPAQPTDSDLHVYEEPTTNVDGIPYIPEPDYEEDEKTLDFNSEDTSGEDEEGLRPDVTPDVAPDVKLRRATIGYSSTAFHQQRHSLGPRQYEGEDLSHYLSDDEAEMTPLPPFTDTLPKPRKYSSKKVKSEPNMMRPKVSQRQSLFKDSGVSGTQPKAGKRKGKGQPIPPFYSVRNFSYADSKYGTKGRATGRQFLWSGGSDASHDRTLSTESEPADDSDMFLNASAQHSSYESFLRSRHGQAMESSDSGVEMTEDLGSGGNSDGRGGGVWKKLTWRLKNRNSRGYSLGEY